MLRLIGSLDQLSEIFLNRFENRFSQIFEGSREAAKAVRSEISGCEEKLKMSPRIQTNFHDYTPSWKSGQGFN